MVSQSPNFFKGAVNSIKLDNWGEEGNCLLLKQMAMKRSLGSSTGGKAQQKQETQFLRNKHSLAETVMLLLCVQGCAALGIVWLGGNLGCAGRRDAADCLLQLLQDVDINALFHRSGDVFCGLMFMVSHWSWSSIILYDNSVLLFFWIGF